MFLWILQRSVQEQRGRCPTGLREPEALHLDHFLNPQGSTLQPPHKAAHVPNNPKSLRIPH